MIVIIDNPDDVTEIKQHIKNAISNPILLEKARVINNNLSKELLDYEKNKNKIIEIYDYLR